jgi:hypothetical protein
MSQILVKFADDHDGELLKVLGEVVAVFGDLEQVLWLTPKRILNIKLSIWKRTLADPEAERRRSIEDRVRSIRETYKKHHGGAIPSDLDLLLKDVKGLNKERHEVIHALWARDMEGSVVRIRLGRILPSNVDVMADLVCRARRVRDRMNDYRWNKPTQAG